MGLRFGLQVILLFVSISTTYGGDRCYYRDRYDQYQFFGYCDHGCCGKEDLRECCKEKENDILVSVVVGGLFGFFVFIGIVVGICICCTCKKPKFKASVVIAASTEEQELKTVSNGVAKNTRASIDQDFLTSTFTVLPPITPNAHKLPPLPNNLQAAASFHQGNTLPPLHNPSKYCATNLETTKENAI